MADIGIFRLASRQAQWLAERRTVVAANVANVNTPGYRAKDIAPFEAQLEASAVALRVSHPAHFVAQWARAVAIEKTENGTGEVTHSRNSVDLDKELLKAGEITGAQSLNTAVVKAFHRMMMASTRG